MKKAGAILAWLLVMLCCFSACSRSTLIRPAADLLNPPLYYPEYEDLVKTFHKKVGADAELCIPHSGDYTSAIVLEDLDQDDSYEALIFYRSEATDSNVNMHYFDKIDGNWISLGDFKGYGTELGSVQTADLDADGMREIIVQWSVSSVSTGDILSVYRSDPKTNTYKEIANELCALAETIDLDQDGRQELFFISPAANGAVPQRYARLVKLSEGSVTLIGEALLDAGVSSYVSVKANRAAVDQPLCLYIDAMVGEQQMITELVYWDAALSQLIAPLLDEKTLTNTATLRYEPIESADFNQDGQMDIPVQSTLFSDPNASVSSETAIYLTEWKRFTGQTAAQPLETVAFTLVNRAESYLIELTEREVSSLGIRDYPDQNLWIVYRRENAGGIGSALFSVIKIPTERWTAETSASYIPIVENEAGVVCVFITQEGADRGLTEETIRSKVRKLS